ncbi:retrovirus-related pol polyprotein from transposon TNT 1-94 [Tanacetum coccineum]
MDMKNHFLHGSLKEDVYVCQPEGFIDANNPIHVYKLKKALDGLKHAPRACPTTYYKSLKNMEWKLVIPLVSQWRPNKLDLDENQTPAQPTEKYFKEVKRIFCYLWGTVNMGLWYTKDYGLELTGFSDADHVGCQDTLKSISGKTQFLSEKLASWSLKK